MRVASCLLLVAITSVRAADVALTPLPSCPGEVRSELREALGPGFQVSIEGKPVAELWPAREVAALSTEKAILGANYGQIAEGAFVGLVRFPQKWSDFRGKTVAAGAYTLRYSVQPADGNHMGVSDYRDYLLLVPLASDVDPKALPVGEALNALSRKASGTNHPPVMSLVPVPAGSTLPSAASSGDTVTVSFKAGSLTLATVVKGRAEE